MKPTFSGPPLTSLQRLASPKKVALEQCELCSVPISNRHRHLLEIQNRQIACACDACALRFDGLIGGRFKLIPRDTRPLPDFKLSDVQWAGLAIPISLAFLFHSTPHKNLVALYPNPAGATEAGLAREDWECLASENPVLNEMEPDVEALLMNRLGRNRDYFIAPIDVCFQLAGLVRMHWRGLSGGEKVWREVDEFFTQLKGDLL